MATKEYMREYNRREDVKRRRLSLVKKWKQENPDKEKSYKKNYYEKMRGAFIEMYGAKCDCCGETETIFLCLDHIGGQRGKKRENAMTAYYRAVKEYNPKEFRILCHNCNQATKWNRVCPHQIEGR